MNSCSSSYSRMWLENVTLIERPRGTTRPAVKYTAAESPDPCAHGSKTGCTPRRRAGGGRAAGLDARGVIQSGHGKRARDVSAVCDGAAGDRGVGFGGEHPLLG